MAHLLNKSGLQRNGFLCGGRKGDGNLQATLFWQAGFDLAVVKLDQLADDGQAQS
jgi:hypothetical protein